MTTFDGRSFIQLAPDPRLRFASVGEGTIEFWVRWNEPASQEDTTIVSLLGADGESIFAVVIKGDGRAIGIPDKKGRLTNPIAFRFDDGELHHVALVTQGGRTTFYIDGRDSAAGSQPRTYPKTADFGVIIGSMTRQQGAFTGSIGDVRMWRRALDRTVIAKKRRLGSRHETLFRLLTLHPNYHDLILYSVLADQIEESQIHYAHPLLGMWKERSWIGTKPTRVGVLDNDQLDDTSKVADEISHGTYVRPPIYTGVASTDSGKILFYENSVYYGLMTYVGEANFSFRLAGGSPPIAFFLDSQGQLVSEIGGPAGAFHVRAPYTKIVLQRPSWSDEPFIESPLVGVSQAVFSGFAQQFDNNFRGWNLKTVNPFMPSMTGKLMKHVFQKPSDKLKPSESGMFIPSSLLYRSIPGGTASSQATVTNSSKEFGMTSSLSMGLAAEIDIMDNGGGFSINAEIKKETQKMSATGSTKITAKSVLLKHVLAADMSRMELDRAFRTRVYELIDGGNFYQFFDEFGSHFPYAVSYGGMMFMETSISSESVSEATKESFDIKGSVEAHVGKKGFGKASMKAEAGFGQGKSEKISSMFENTEINVFWSGGDGMMSADPASTQNPLGDSVTAVYLDLRPIYQLLSPQFFDDPRIYNDLRHAMVNQLNNYIRKANALAPPPPQLAGDPDRYVEVSLQNVTLATAKTITNGSKVSDLTPPKMSLHLKAKAASHPIGPLEGEYFTQNPFDIGTFVMDGPDDWIEVERNEDKPKIVDTDEERKKKQKAKEDQGIGTYSFRVPGHTTKGGSLPQVHISLDAFMKNYTGNEGSKTMTPTLPNVFQNSSRVLSLFNIGETPKHQHVRLDGTWRSEWYEERQEDFGNEFLKVFGQDAKHDRKVSDVATTLNMDFSVRLVPSFGIVYTQELQRKMALMKQLRPPQEIWRQVPISPTMRQGTPIDVPTLRVGERGLPFQQHILAYYSLDEDILDYSGREAPPLSTDSQIIKDEALAVSPTAEAKTYIPGGTAEQFTVHFDFYPMSTDDFGLLTAIAPEILSVTSKGGLIQATVANETSTLIDKPLALGRWHKLVVVWALNNHEVRFYLNSLELSSMRLPVGYRLPRTHRARIDARGVLISFGQETRPFIGLIDEVMIYKKALAKAQVAELNVRPRAHGELAPNETSMFDETVPEFGGSWLVGSLAPLHPDLSDFSIPNILFEQQGGILKAPLIDGRGRTFAHFKMITNRKHEIRLELEEKGKSKPIRGWVGTLDDEKTKITWGFEESESVRRVVRQVDKTALSAHQRIAEEARSLFKVINQGPDQFSIANLPPTLAPMAGTFQVYDTDKNGTVTFDETYRSMLIAAKLDPNAQGAVVGTLPAVGDLAEIPLMEPWRRFDLNGNWRQDNQDLKTSLVYEIGQKGMQMTVSAGGFVAYEGDYLGASGLEFRKNGEVIGALLSTDGLFITLDDGNIWKRLDENGNPPTIDPPPFASRSGYYDRGREDLLVVRQFGLARMTFFLIRENDPTGGKVLESSRTGSTYTIREGARTYIAAWDTVSKLTITEVTQNDDELGSIAGPWDRINMSGTWHHPVNGGEVHVVSKNSALYVYDQGFHNITGIVMPTGLQFSKVTDPSSFFRARLQPPGNYLVIQFNDIITWKRGKPAALVTTDALRSEMDTALAAVRLGSKARKAKLLDEIRTIKVNLANPETLERDKPGLDTRLAALTRELSKRYPDRVANAGPSGDGAFTGRWRDPASKFVYGISHSGNQATVVMLTEAGKFYWKEVTGTATASSLAMTIMNSEQRATLSPDGKQLTWSSGAAWERLASVVQQPVLTGTWINRADSSVFSIAQDYSALDVTPAGGPNGNPWPAFEAAHQGSHLAFNSKEGEFRVKIEDAGERLVFSDDMSWHRVPSLSGAWFDSQGGYPLTITQDGLTLTITCDSEDGAKRYAKSFTATQHGLVLSLNLPFGKLEAILQPSADTIILDANRSWQRKAPIDGRWKEAKTNQLFTISITDGVVSVTPDITPFPGMKFVGSLLPDGLSVTFGVIKAAGAISADNATITWKDGRVWTKQR